MNNRYLASRFVEVIQDLAAGVEPVDAGRGGRVAPPLYLVRDIALTDEQRVRLRDERQQASSAFPAVRKSNTCRFKLLYSDIAFNAAEPWVRVRLIQGVSDYSPRHFVPRRLQIPLQERATAELDVLEKRVHRPALFPGADYPIHETATGVRGRVQRGGLPMRWARVEARRIADGKVIGRAHGDDRGEFLLVLQSDAAVASGTELWLTIRMFVHGPSPVPVPASTLEAQTDSLWDLPLELLPSSAAESDPISSGEQLPTSYTSSVSRDLRLRLGMISSDTDPYLIT